MSNFPSQANQLLNIENNFALILTATICVDNLPRVYPADKSVREQQYLNTLNCYLHNHPRLKKIIFIENSGSSLNALEQATQNNPYQKQVEFISLNNNLSYGFKGKGFGECLLIQEGLKQSNIIESVTHFGKLTGRIYLENITQILETCPDNFDCICDYKDQGYILKNTLAKKKRFAPFCDTRFIAFSWKFYSKYLESLHLDFIEKHPNQGFFIEPEYYRVIHSLEKEANIIKRFKNEPKFCGVSGHSGGKKYGGKDYDSFSEKLKYQFRIAARQLFPWLHI
ncbi:hypothetical protein [Crocosphaera watsonii]|uniref:Uncharacterized protein n=2 Tax=Crocosphaera watsonii TaxID=263511 RepID=G5J330_CROWT|nr:hypothetical protein [Crocosphaera watsonii]EHJ13393.1 hypothetical protein CWATWH0003_1910 [Crocosphaera watsonii WH 0003]CCQ57381.1 hypothetical protein CWATWH0005_583 [Crocosphaera watsonii WH 0005]